jgi:hypothetical protein
MLGAIALHQVGLGLILIVAFSTGLAGTLMGIGLLMVYSGRAAGRLRLGDRLGFGTGARLARLTRVVPVLSAGVVSLAGVGLTVEAVGQLGATSLLTRAQPWALLLLAGVAIALTAVLGLRRSRRIPSDAGLPVLPVERWEPSAAVGFPRGQRPTSARHADQERLGAGVPL